MIRRIVEYVIHCDAERVGGECSDPSCNAYGADTKEQCAEHARKHGYVQVSKKYWLCRRCAEKYLPKTETSTPATAARGTG